MSEYSIFWAKGNYDDRQEAANREGCDVYIEHHFNALAYDKPGTDDNPALCLVAHNASQTSKTLAADYSNRVASEFGYKNRGVIQLEYKGRGDFNLRFTKMPAFLVEPLFVSDPEQAVVAQSDIGQLKLARILVETIKAQYPAGAKVAFSVGHKYKESSPYDRGAPVVNSTATEADLAELVLKKAAAILLNGDEEGEEAEGLEPTACDCAKELRELSVKVDHILGKLDC